MRTKGKAKGTLGRTPRMRFVEPKNYSDGNPFFALRVPKEVLRAFKLRAEKSKCSPTAMVRAYMAKMGGVSLTDNGGGDE